jgi:sister chromatid cohesion protein DCC1
MESHCLSSYDAPQRHRFAIKGHTSDDAVLCTSDKTYALRSVVLSNTTLVVTSEYAPGHVVIRDQLNELLELVPVIPKLHKLTSLLRGMEYDDSNLQADEGIGNHDDDDDGGEDSIVRDPLGLLHESH